jgi:hypothetical protein
MFRLPFRGHKYRAPNSPEADTPVRPLLHFLISHPALTRFSVSLRYDVIGINRLIGPCPLETFLSQVKVLSGSSALVGQAKSRTIERLGVHFGYEGGQSVWSILHKLPIYRLTLTTLVLSGVSAQPGYPSLVELIKMLVNSTPQLNQLYLSCIDSGKPVRVMSDVKFRWILICCRNMRHLSRMCVPPWHPYGT